MNQNEIIKILQAYAQQAGVNFEELLNDFSSETPENKQIFIQEALSALQQEAPVNENGYYDEDPSQTPAVTIPGSEITMENIDYPIRAIGGSGKDYGLMYPDQNYSFPEKVKIMKIFIKLSFHPKLAITVHKPSWSYDRNQLGGVMVVFLDYMNVKVIIWSKYRIVSFITHLSTKLLMSYLRLRNK